MDSDVVIVASYRAWHFVLKNIYKRGFIIAFLYWKPLKPVHAFARVSFRRGLAPSTRREVGKSNGWCFVCPKSGMAPGASDSGV